MPTTADCPPPTVKIWLTLCLLLVACMVLIGGYTRLSGSGLSITTWKPVYGVIPPMNELQWNEEFSAYQSSPQYQKINNGMSLEDFKTIFWPEFIHRLLGRAVGIIFFVPLLYFAVCRNITRQFGLRLLAIFALGGLQGLIGWLMVKSGLVDDPHVSHLRLALHLSVAFTIFGLIEWTLLDVTSYQLPVARKENKRLLVTSKRYLIIYFLFFALLCAQIILGAFMAGLHAGLIFNTWPTMNGQWIPDGLITDSPWYNNVALIQLPSPGQY